MVPNIEDCLSGRVLFMGIGNIDLGDDGVGVFLARELKSAGVKDVIDSGTTPEHWVGQIGPNQFDNIVLLDAVNSGSSPGTVIFMDATQVKERYPQVSTHKISLGMVAELLEKQSSSKIWLIGVQPAHLKEGEMLSEEVSVSLATLADLITARCSLEMSC